MSEIENKEEEISAFQFTDACRIGINVIDTEHEHLFELMNQVLTSISNPDMDEITLEEYVHILLNYGDTHFKHEEDYMEKIHDGELVHQKLAHNMFVNKVSAVDIHGLNDAEKRKMVYELLRYNVDWLYKHILYSDILIGKVKHLATVAAEKKAYGEDAVYCPFEEQLLTGYALVDNRHRQWFDILDEAYTVMENNYSEAEYDHEMRLLDELEASMIDGFNEEEDIMHEAHYQCFKNHRQAHTACLGRLTERDLAHDVDNPKEVIEELLDFLYAWLVNHILRTDKLMVKDLGLDK